MKEKTPTFFLECKKTLHNIRQCTAPLQRSGVSASPLNCNIERHFHTRSCSQKGAGLPLPLHSKKSATQLFTPLFFFV